MLAHQPLELGDELGLTAECEVGVDARLERGQAEFLEAADLGLGERLVGEVGERRSAPQAESLAQKARGQLGR